MLLSSSLLFLLLLSICCFTHSHLMVHHCRETFVLILLQPVLALLIHHLLLKCHLILIFVISHFLPIELILFGVLQLLVLHGLNVSIFIQPAKWGQIFTFQVIHEVLLLDVVFDLEASHMVKETLATLVLIIQFICFKLWVYIVLLLLTPHLLVLELLLWL